MVKQNGKINIDELTSVRSLDEGKKESIGTLRKVRNQDFALSAQDFWYFCTYVVTEDEDQKKQRGFPLNYQYLHRTHHIVENHQKTLILKARRLLISWYGMLRQLHNAMFAGTGLPDTHGVYRGGVMSIGETEAKYLIQRIRRVYRRLPPWMQERNRLIKDNEMYLEFERGGTIQAFPLKREGPQTFGFSEVFFDEMALQEAVRTVWTGMIPTLGSEGKLLAVSTPNGKTNLFYDIWSNKDAQYPGVYRLRLHWTENPEHDEAWFVAATAGMDKQMIARMFELSFAAYYGKPVWSTEWNPTMHVVDSTDVVEDRPMFLGWDFGYHFPAVVFFQRNSRDQWVGHDELMLPDMSFDKFCERVIEKANTFYNREKIAEIHCVPPDGRSRYRARSITGATCDIDEIQRQFRTKHRRAQVRLGPNEVGTRNMEGPRLKETRKTFHLRADNEPGMFVSERMETFIEGCNGGYCYPETGDSEEPMKNEYSHIQDAYQAVVVAFNRMAKSAVLPDKSDEIDKFNRQRRRIGGRTGL